MYSVSFVAGGTEPPLELGPFRFVEFKDNGAVYAETYPPPGSHFGIGQVLATREGETSEQGGTRVPTGWFKAEANQISYQSCVVKYGT